MNEFDYVVKYLKVKNNLSAGALSRNSSDLKALATASIDVNIGDFEDIDVIVQK